MIPRVIELKNFLSYGDPIQKVDFKNHDLICLSGKNGNGKSALLDAFSWAIWGQARKITGVIKADEGLLRLGQTRMMVCAEFEFAQQIYRIRREFAKTYGKPYSALDFEIFDASRDAFSSLTEKTIRATQDKIEHLIGLDYETFINTSFLRQGQANEFSKKNPKERKQILATILGLSKYEALQQQAIEASRQLVDQKKLISQLIEQSKQELDQEANLIKQRDQEKTASQKFNQMIQQLQTALSGKEQELAIFAEFKNQRTRLIEEQKVGTQKYHQKLEQLKVLLIAWKKNHKNTLALPNIQELETQKHELLKQEKNFLELRQKNIALQEQQLVIKQQLQQRHLFLTAELEKNVQAKRLELEKQQLHIQQNTTILEQKQKLLKDLAQKHTALTADLSTIQSNQKKLEVHLKNYQENKKQFEKRRAFYQTLIQKGNWLKNAYQEHDHKKRIVEDLANPACPLCEQVLTAKRKQFLGSKLIVQEHLLQHQMKRISTIIKRLKDLLLEQHKNIEQQEKDADSFKQYIEQERMIHATLIDITPACDQLVTEVTELQNHITQGTQLHEQHSQALQRLEKEGRIIIDQDAEITKFTQQLTKLEQEKDAFKFNQAAYLQLQERMKKLELTMQNRANLHTDREQQTVRRTQIHHLIGDLKEHKKNVGHITEQLQTLSAKLEQETNLAQSIEALKKDLVLHVEQKEQSTQHQAKLEHELQRIEKIKATTTERQTQVSTLEQEIDDYQTLAQAFSKNGIQALLIEEAIPEIEQEANALLARLTDNQAQIFIESLRDLKSGGAKESLDIHISDAAGIRPYEMYSGGEAFRIDFALRIAISKLLAQRAGTALQTLIIDEGFGSQDEEGLARITDALYTIKHDFSKIIIVSHLPELKDSFPVHFVVEKQASGSIVHIEERG